MYNVSVVLLVSDYIMMSHQFVVWLIVTFINKALSLLRGVYCMKII